MAGGGAGGGGGGGGGGRRGRGWRTQGKNERRGEEKINRQQLHTVFLEALPKCVDQPGHRTSS